MKRTLWVLPLALSMVAFGLIASASQAAASAVATFTVSNTLDGGAGSLRQAIVDANSNPGADTVDFAVSGTIMLGSTLPVISDDLTLVNDRGILDGTRQGVTISGNHAVRIMQINPGVKVALTALTIANGSGGSGGGIDNAGVLNVTESTFSDNASSGDGGAINNTGTLILSSCTFSGNSASGRGGAINNTAILFARACTISGNSAPLGGGIYDSSSTPPGNNHFYNTLYNMIIARNTNGLAIPLDGFSDCVNAGPILLQITNSLMGESCGIASPTNLILGFFSYYGLAPLADNGGPTWTFALLPDSPAINIGQGAGGSAALLFDPIALPTDQRGVGFSRRCNSSGAQFASAVDAGAFELHEATDASPPTAAPIQSPNANGAGWNNSDVTVRWNWSDCGAGIDYTNTTTSSTSSGEGASVSLTANAKDNAGFTAAASATVKVDKTTPELSPAVNPNPVPLNGAATATAGASDTISGIATQGCDPLDTSSVGTKSVRCTAIDNAGNSNSANASYTVNSAPQTVAFGTTAPSAAFVGGPTYTPTASSTSLLPVTITVDGSSASVCRIDAGVVSFQTAGTCLLDANQAGNANYMAALQQQQSFSVYEKPLFVLANPSATASVGQPYGYTFQASGSPTLTYTLAAGAPSWLSINPGSGVLSGTPPAGTTSFTYSVIATNTVGQATAGPFGVTVSAPPPTSTRADVSSTLSCPTTVRVNVNATCTLTVRNAGPATAKSVTAVLELPPTLSRVSVSNGGAWVHNVAKWTLSSLAANASATFTVTFKPVATKKVTIWAAAASLQPDPNYFNNVTSASETITP